MFVSTHLCHLSETNRLAQVTKLAELLGNVDGRVILAGDLNARPASAPMQTLLKEWRNPLEDEQTIDYVLVRQRDGWQPVSARKIAEPAASDHDPVVVELAWPDSP
jgi:endonuclease/exonuclease/phosphatase family metal-dependent hydrolase